MSAAEYRWSWAYFACACVFTPTFICLAIFKGGLFDYVFGGVLAAAWALHLFRPFYLRRKYRCP